MPIKQQQEAKIIFASKEDVASPKDLAVVVKTLIQAVKEVKTQLEKLIKQETEDEARDRQQDIELVNSKIEEVKKEDEKQDAILEKRIVAQIPKIPDPTDIKPLEERVLALENEEDIEIPEPPTVEELLNDLPKLGIEIRNALELLSGDERLDISAVKGLEALQKTIEELKNRKFPEQTHVVAHVRSMQLYDLSSQTNGVLKTFSVPGVTKPLYVIGSDFPYVLFLNIGYTYSAVNNTITLIVDNPPSSGSNLGFMFIE